MVRKNVHPDWSREILALRRRLKLSQSDFASRLDMSAMSVSRWERAQIEPTAESYIRLGNLCQGPVCWFFWGRAGIKAMDIVKVLPVARRRLNQGRIGSVQVVNAGAGKHISAKTSDFVAIPILPVDAATLGEHSDEVSDIDLVQPESLWAAPASWCPNPAQTISLRVKGNSMSPLILNGYIIAVDTSNISREELLGQIVVAWNKKARQLVVSRLLRFDNTDVLVSDQRENQSISLASESAWRIVGKVLWWAGKPDCGNRADEPASFSHA